MKTKRLNRHQERFLRNLRRHPEGLPPELLPRAGAIERWLGDERFCQRLREVSAATTFLVRLNVQSATLHAAHHLAAALGQGGDHLQHVPTLLRVLRQPATADRNHGRNLPGGLSSLPVGRRLVTRSAILKVSEAS